MSTKFFTNKDENTLLNKLEGLFQHKKPYYFDALVGFFRASGYFRIRKFLDQVSEVRILVGINVDNLVFEATSKGMLFNSNDQITKEDFLINIKSDIQNSDYRKDIEEGMSKFIEDLVNKKIIIKAHPSKNIHAKIYIFREEEKHNHGYGMVITGSSNLTEAGLEKNFEFNVELRDNEDIDFALKTFEELWHEGVEINLDFVDRIKNETFLNQNFTPFEVYMKLLIEYFGKAIDYDPESVSDLPQGYKKLAYQVEAVNDGFRKLQQHNGFFLSDVVGLGKTIVSIMIAKKFYFYNGYHSKILIVTPPALEQGWKKTVRDFELNNVDYCTNGSLHKIKYPEEYDLIIVDEAHKFRSDTSSMFDQLQKICKTPRRRPSEIGDNVKKVILISATPLNNRPEDIRNLVYLFQDSKDSTLEIGNIQHFFVPLIKKYKDLKKETNFNVVQQEIKKISEQIRTKVLEPLTIRRTRTDIKQTESYARDIEEQGVIFPNVIPPKQILYVLDEELDQLYDNTLHCLKNEIQYYRYRAISFLKPEHRNKYKYAEQISQQLTKIMKTLLVKRIDSSFHAFKMSLKRFFLANQAMVKMFENNKVYIAPNLEVSKFIIEDREDELIDLINNLIDKDPSITICGASSFEPEFFEGLKRDNELLGKLNKKWEKIDIDPKFDKFVETLKDDLFNPEYNIEGKLVVFSESKETTSYLKNRLNEEGFNKVISVDSSNRKDMMAKIQKNFDANLKLEDQENDFSIILTTEVLAEGVNLHRSNIIVNYDIPWNTTRLMQRIGRVNRIGTTAPNIFIYNFFPTSRTDSEIELNKKAYMKLQSFHSMLGEDSQIYSTQEEFESFGMFDKNPEEYEQRDERLISLMELRKFKQESPDLFRKVKNMPLRARTGRKNKILHKATICYLKNPKRDSFYYIKPDMTYEELTFSEVVKQFHCNFNEKSVNLHDLHHEQVQKATNLFEEEITQESLKNEISPTLGPNEKKAISFLDGFFMLPFINPEEKDLINLTKNAILKGKFQKLPREINELRNNQKKAKLNGTILLETLIKLIKQYPLEQNDEVPVIKKVKIKDIKPKIIISESFI